MFGEFFRAAAVTEEPPPFVASSLGFFGGVWRGGEEREEREGVGGALFVQASFLRLLGFFNFWTQGREKPNFPDTQKSKEPRTH